MKNRVQYKEIRKGEKIEREERQKQKIQKKIEKSRVQVNDIYRAFEEFTFSNVNTMGCIYVSCKLFVTYFSASLDSCFRKQTFLEHLYQKFRCNSLTFSHNTTLSNEATLIIQDIILNVIFALSSVNLKDFSNKYQKATVTFNSISTNLLSYCLLIKFKLGYCSMFRLIDRCL